MVRESHGLPACMSPCPPQHKAGEEDRGKIVSPIVKVPTAVSIERGKKPQSSSLVSLFDVASSKKIEKSRPPPIPSLSLFLLLTRRPPFNILSLSPASQNLKQSSDEEQHDVHFESSDSGASLTFPQQAGTIRKNAHLVVKGRPCKVADVSTSKTGE